MSVLTHSTTSKTNWDFDPRSIPDCDIWFDAADTDTITTRGATSTVAIWKNKGSIDMNAIEDTVGANGSPTLPTIVGNSIPSIISIPAGTQMAFTCALSSQERTWFIVGRCATQLVFGSSPQYWGIVGNTVSGQDNMTYSRTASGSTTFTYGSSASGLGSQVSTNVAPNSFGDLAVLCYVQSATATTDSTITINGTTYAPNVNQPATQFLTTSQKYLINNASYNTNGQYGEIIHYNRAITRQERIAVEGYLMWKWGIKRRNESGFIPTNIGGCLAWYDADVNYADATSRATSFTFSSGDSVSVWKDKSGNGRDATFLNTSPSTARPILTASQVAGKSTVVFNGTNILSSPLSLATTQPITVFLVAASTSLGAFRAAVSLNANPGTRGSLLSIYQSSGNLWWFSGGNVSTDGQTSSISVASGRYDIVANYWNTTIRTQMNINGHHVQASTSSPSSLRANSTMLIGGTTSAVAGSTTPAELWVGGIAEVIVYNSILTTDQRNQVERYLSLKWNRPLVNACPIGHPNKWAPDFSRTFVPTDISGCCLWLDGSDEGSVTLSGTTVTEWRDKSGSGYLGAFSAGRNFTYASNIKNGLNVIQTATGQTMTISNFALGASMTVFHLYMPIDQSTGSAFIEHGPNTNSSSGFYFFSQNNFNYAISNGGTFTYTNFGTTANSNTWELITAINKDPSASNLMAFYSNGVLKSSGGNSLTNTTTTNTLYINGRNNTNTLSYPTYIAEIIIYNVALTSGQRKAVEGYLANKWGLRQILPTTHPVYFPTPPAATSFVPTDISGCALWLDGADSSAASMTLSGTNMTQWKDKSGNGFTGTAFNNPQLISNGLNGQSVVQFTSASSQYVDFGDVNDMRTNQLNIFVVCKFTLTTGDGSIIAKSFAGDGAGRYALIRESNVIKPIIGLATSANNSGWTSTSTAVRLFRMRWNRSTITLHENGTSVFSTAFSSALDLNNTYKLLIGGYTNNAQNGQVSALYFNGLIAEVIVYLGTLTDKNVATIENYLADKWGMLTSAQVTSPSLFYNPQVSDTLNFNPATSISGCRMWIDASDTATINSGSITAGGTITSLTDKSGTGLTLTPAGTPFWDYLLNKLPTINLTYGRFNGSFPSAITNFVHTCFIVCTLNSNPTAGYPCFGIANAATSASRWLRCLDWATSIRTVAFFSNVPVTLITPPANGTPFLWACTFNGINPLSSIYNAGASFNTSSTVSVAPGANASHFSLGGEPYSGIGSATNTWPGYVSELIVYDRVLSNVDRIRVEKYLARKWGLTQSILAANRFVNPGAIPDSPRILPTTFADIALWLDAADPDADGILPASGTKIGTWIDKSGNSKTCVQTTESQKPTLTFDGIYPAIQFSSASSQFMVGTSLLTSLNYGVFIVSEYTGPTGSGAAVSFFNRKVTTTNAENYVVVTDFSYGSIGGSSIANRTLLTTTYNSSGTWKYAYYLIPEVRKRLHVISDSSATPGTANDNVFYRNGELITQDLLSQGTALNVATDAEGYRIGVSNYGGTLGNYFTGNIYEVIVMLHRPTTQERQYIEGYLAWKWGVNSSLPSTHMFNKFNP